MVYMRHPRSIEHMRIVSEKIMLGLDFLHEQDLQPVNVMFSVEGIEDSQEFLDSPYFRHVEEERRMLVFRCIAWYHNGVEHQGPNGIHLYLVFPVMMCDSQDITYELIDHLKKDRKPCDVECVRSVSEKILLGLDLLHQRGIVHTDLKPANILFSTVGVRQYDELLRPPALSPVVPLEGVERDDSAPKYLVSPQQRRVRLDSMKTSNILVKIGDLAGALRSDQFDQKPVTPLALHAPELTDQRPWDEKIDIWTLGCLIYSN